MTERHETCQVGLRRSPLSVLEAKTCPEFCNSPGAPRLSIPRRKV